MTLLLDTTDPNYIIIGIEESRHRYDQEQTGGWHDQHLLRLIDEALRQKRLTLQDITAIQVAVGPGSFTGTRVGVAVANALGWGRSIPINQQPIGVWAEAKYDRPPNISQPRPHP